MGNLCNRGVGGGNQTSAVVIPAPQLDAEQTPSEMPPAEEPPADESKKVSHMCSTYISTTNISHTPFFVVCQNETQKAEESPAEEQPKVVRQLFLMNFVVHIYWSHTLCFCFRINTTVMNTLGKKR